MVSSTRPVAFARLRRHRTLWGLTTFSTFSLEVVDLACDGDTSAAVLYAVASVASALIGVTVGAAGLRRLRAITLPLEEQP